MAGGKDEVIGRTYLVYCALAVSREAVERVGVLASGGSRMQAPWLPQFRARKKWAVAKCKKGFYPILPFPSAFFSRTLSLPPPPKGAPLDLSEAANTPRPTHQPPWSSSRDPNADKSAGGACARWISISSLFSPYALPAPAFPARSHTGQGRPARMGCCSTTSWREGGRVTAQRPPEGHGDPQQPTVARVVAFTQALLATVPTGTRGTRTEGNRWGLPEQAGRRE